MKYAILLLFIITIYYITRKKNKRIYEVKEICPKLNLIKQYYKKIPTSKNHYLLKINNFYN